MNKKAQAVLFDLDGTLADTMPEITRAMNHTLCAFNFPERTYAEMRNCINYGVRELVRLAFPQECTPELLEEALGLYQNNYGSLYLETKRPYDGMYEVLAHLKKQDYRLGVISNKTHEYTVRLIDQIFGLDVFDVVIGQGRFPRKPDPDVGYYVAERLGLAPGEIIFVGDSHVDVHFAKNTGMIPLSVTWGYRDKEVLVREGARHFANTPLELIPMIEKLNM